MNQCPNGKFFVEVGACNGIDLSNTYLLEKKGWEGICVEPRPIFKKLKENRSCHVDGRCVARESGLEVDFWLCKKTPALSGRPQFFNDSHNRKRKRGRLLKRRTVSLIDLLKEYNAPKYIDYLSLDTEGSELDILEGFNFSDYIFKYITVEHNHSNRKQAIRKLLERYEYAVVQKRWDFWCTLKAKIL
jgi:FkbM family methyltransferase